MRVARNAVFVVAAAIEQTHERDVAQERGHVARHKLITRKKAPLTP